jgi:hypothetical protein
MVCYELGRSGSGYGSVEGSCEDGNEPSGAIKCWEVKDEYVYRHSRVSSRDATLT